MWQARQKHGGQAGIVEPQSVNGVIYNIEFPYGYITGDDKAIFFLT
jgi:hypothetical protein